MHVCACCVPLLVSEAGSGAELDSSAILWQASMQPRRVRAAAAHLAVADDLGIIEPLRVDALLAHDRSSHATGHRLAPEVQHHVHSRNRLGAPESSNWCKPQCQALLLSPGLSLLCLSQSQVARQCGGDQQLLLENGTPPRAQEKIEAALLTVHQLEQPALCNTHLCTPATRLPVKAVTLLPQYREAISLPAPSSNSPAHSKRVHGLLALRLLFCLWLGVH